MNKDAVTGIVGAAVPTGPAILGETHVPGGSRHEHDVDRSIGIVTVARSLGLAVPWLRTSRRFGTTAPAPTARFGLLGVVFLAMVVGAVVVPAQSAQVAQRLELAAMDAVAVRGET